MYPRLHLLPVIAILNRKFEPPPRAEILAGAQIRWIELARNLDNIAFPILANEALLTVLDYLLFELWDHVERDAKIAKIPSPFCFRNPKRIA